jgi:hypothetical protein
VLSPDSREFQKFIWTEAGEASDVAFELAKIISDRFGVPEPDGETRFNVHVTCAIFQFGIYATLIANDAPDRFDTFVQYFFGAVWDVFGEGHGFSADRIKSLKDSETQFFTSKLEGKPVYHLPVAGNLGASKSGMCCARILAYLWKENFHSDRISEIQLVEGILSGFAHETCGASIVRGRLRKFFGAKC